MNKSRLKDSVAKINRSSVNTCFKFSDVYEHDILKVVKTMKSNACGVDEVSSFFIKLSIEYTAKVFADIVNASLKTGRFPSNWKKARIKPIPKITEPMIASDFRPISLLVAFSKIIVAVGYMGSIFHRELTC